MDAFGTEEGTSLQMLKENLLVGTSLWFLKRNQLADAEEKPAYGC